MSWINIEGHRLHTDRIVDYEVTAAGLLKIWYARTPNEVNDFWFYSDDAKHAAYKLDVAKGLRKKVEGKKK